jgi:hypothetical protein
MVHLLAVIAASPNIFVPGKRLTKQRLFLQQVQSLLQDILYGLEGISAKLKGPPAGAVKPLLAVLFLRD